MTVKSLIESKLEYSEDKTIDVDDIHYSTSIYDYNLFNENVEIALGKGKENSNDYNIVYYSIYLIYNSELKSRIGVFEAKGEHIVELIDENGNVDLSKVHAYIVASNEEYGPIGKGNMIIFINEEDFKKVLNMPSKSKTEQEDSEEEEENKINTLEDDEEEEDDVTEIKIKTQDVNEEPIDSWYVENAELKKGRIKSETKEESNKEKELFKRSSTSLWIQSYMKNVNYNIVENEGSGDCFFAVLRLSLIHI